MIYVNGDDLVSGLNSGMGGSITGRSVTAILYISPNGDDTDGSSWARAYTTIQGTLAVASTDVNECTLFILGINTGPTDFYDIDTTGDPTYTGNYVFQGTHRTWAKIKNTHGTATSILKFTGYTSFINMNFNLGAGSGNGIIVTKGAFRVRQCQFVGEDLTGAATALHIDGATILKHGIIEDCQFLGHTTHMTALKLDKVARSYINRCIIHECATGIQIVDAVSDKNTFCNLDIGHCGLGLDLDAGNEQHFCDLLVHSNTVNVDDEVGDHIWNGVIDSLPMIIEPDDLVGVTLTAGADANLYGADTELRAAVTSTVPFRVVGVIVEPQIAQWYNLRLSADSGVSFFDHVMLSTDRAAGSVAPSGTESIFNKGTRISGSVKAESGGNDTMKVWLKIQEI